MKFNRHVWPKATVPERDFLARNNFHPELYRRIKDLLPETPAIALEIFARRGAFSAGLLSTIPTVTVYAMDVWKGRSGIGDLRAWMKRNKDHLYKRAFPLPGHWAYWHCRFPLEADLVYISPPNDLNEAATYIRLCKPFITYRGVLVINGVHGTAIGEAAQAFIQDEKRESAYRVDPWGPGRGAVGWLPWV